MEERATDAKRYPEEPQIGGHFIRAGVFNLNLRSEELHLIPYDVSFFIKNPIGTESEVLAKSTYTQSTAPLS